MKYLIYIIFVFILFSSCSDKFYPSKIKNKSLFGNYYVIKKDSTNGQEYSIIEYTNFLGKRKIKRTIIVHKDGSIEIYPNKKNGWIIIYDDKGNKTKRKIRHGSIELYTPILW